MNNIKTTQLGNMIEITIIKDNDKFICLYSPIKEHISENIKNILIDYSLYEEIQKVTINKLQLILKELF